MGPSTPLDHAIGAVIGLSRAAQQRDICVRLRARADERMAAGDVAGAEALTLMAGELSAELAPEEEPA